MAQPAGGNEFLAIGVAGCAKANKSEWKIKIGQLVTRTKFRSGDSLASEMNKREHF
jgi:hypothetical protein